MNLLLDSKGLTVTWVKRHEAVRGNFDIGFAFKSGDRLNPALGFVSNVQGRIRLRPPHCVVAVATRSTSTSECRAAALTTDPFTPCRTGLFGGSLGYINLKRLRSRKRKNR